MMKKASLFILLTVIFAIYPHIIWCDTSEIRGSLHFTDNTIVHFYDFESIDIWIEGYGSSRSGKENIYLRFENSTRSLPINKIKSFEVQNWEFRTGWVVYANVLLKIKTQITLNQKYVLGKVSVKILDKLTQEVKVQTFYFKDQKTDKLNIKAIYFDD